MIKEFSKKDLTEVFSIQYKLTKQGKRVKITSMKSKLKWNTISIMKMSLFTILISLIIGIFRKELLFFGLGGLVALMHFYMIFEAVQNNWKASNYLTRSAFLLFSILGAVWLLGNNFWYFLPGLFLVKGIIMIFVLFDRILSKVIGK